MTAWLWGVGLQLGLAVTTPADPSPADRLDLVQWHAPVMCPDQSQLRGRVDALTRGATAPAGLTFAFEVASDAEAGLVMAYHDGSSGSPRRFESRDCEELAEAAAVIVALAIGADLDLEQMTAATRDNTKEPTDRAPLAETKPATSQPEPVKTTRDGTRTDAAITRTTRTRHRRGTRDTATWTGSIDALGQWNSVPGGWPQLALGVGRRGRVITNELRVIALPFARAYVDDDHRYGARLSLWLAELRACGTAIGGVSLCVSGLGGVARARGIAAVDKPNTAVSPWLALAAGAVYRVPRPHITWRAAIDATFTPVRARFVVDGAGTVCCSATWGLRFGIGGEFDWPTRGGNGA